MRHSNALNRDRSAFQVTLRIVAIAMYALAVFLAICRRVMHPGDDAPQAGRQTGSLSSNEWEMSKLLNFSVKSLNNCFSSSGIALGDITVDAQQIVSGFIHYNDLR